LKGRAARERRSSQSAPPALFQVADITTAVAGRRRAAWPDDALLRHEAHVRRRTNHGGAGKDQVLSVDLTKGVVDQTVTLTVPLFAALWATCDGSGVIGGVSFSSSSTGTASFGTVDTKGTYTLKSKVQVSSGLMPSRAPHGDVSSGARGQRGVTSGEGAALVLGSDHCAPC